jgi:hypothetical protein
VPLPDGTYAYGRVHRDAVVCFYRTRSRSPATPPIGEREYELCVAVYDDVVAGWQRVGVDDFDEGDDGGWPPPMVVQDAISGEAQVYHRGEMRPAEQDEVAGLEPAGVWNEEHVTARLSPS